jgi:bifunctional enzyme CysN/CysC
MSDTIDFGSAEADLAASGRERGAQSRVVVCGGAGHGRTTLSREILGRGASGAATEASKKPSTSRFPALEGLDLIEHSFDSEGRSCRLIDASEGDPGASRVAAAVLDSNLAILVVDASRGILAEDRHHRFVLSSLGMNRIVLAVNKMDLVDYDPQLFDRIVEDYKAWPGASDTIEIVPVSARAGDNVAAVSSKTPWYSGPTLKRCLAGIESPPDRSGEPLRIAVRPEPEATGGPGRVLSGPVLAGTVRPGDSVRTLPGGVVTRIDRVRGLEGARVALSLRDDVDPSRTWVVTAADAPCSVADQFETRILWTGASSLVSGRQYKMRIGTAETLCTPSRPKYRIDPFSMDRLAAKTLSLNEVGICDVAVESPVAFEPFETSRDLGTFLLFDRMTDEPVAVGVINFALRRSTNVHVQALDVDKGARSAIKGHRPAVLWFTGLSSSGKSTISNLVERGLNSRGCHTVLLDGDNVRHGLNRDLGFTEADRAENIRRIAEVAKLMTDAGLIALVSFISPFAAERRTARELIGADQFLEIFVDAPLSVAESRDPKGLYKKARRGEIKNFTGIGSPYERPAAPDLHLETARLSAEDAAARVMQLLEDRGLLA